MNLRHVAAVTRWNFYWWSVPVSVTQILLATRNVTRLSSKRIDDAFLAIVLFTNFTGNATSPKRLAAIWSLFPVSTAKFRLQCSAIFNGSLTHRLIQRCVVKTTVTPKGIH